MNFSLLRSPQGGSGARVLFRLAIVEVCFFGAFMLLLFDQGARGLASRILTYFSPSASDRLTIVAAWREARSPVELHGQPRRVLLLFALLVDIFHIHLIAFKSIAPENVGLSRQVLAVGLAILEASDLLLHSVVVLTHHQRVPIFYYLRLLCFLLLIVVLQLERVLQVALGVHIFEIDSR